MAHNAADLKNSIERYITIVGKTDLAEVIILPHFEEITKLELEWFIIYHPQKYLPIEKNSFPPREMIKFFRRYIQKSALINKFLTD